MKSKITNLKVALTFVAATMLTLTSHAAVIVNFGETVPTSDIITSYDPVGVEGGIGWANTYDPPNPTVIRNIGQSFITSASVFSMSAITMKLANSPIFPDPVDFTISFFKLTGPGQLPTDGTFLSSQSGTVQTTGAAIGSYFTFTLDSAVTLEASSTYAYVLALTTTTPTGVIVLAISEGFPDPNGTRVSRTNLNEVLTETSVYYIQGSAIPEPGSIALLGLGAGFALLMRRKSLAKHA